MKLWIWMDTSGDYSASRRRPKKYSGTVCGLENCEQCPVEEGYKTAVSAPLCKDDFETMLGKGFRKGLHQVEVKKL